MGAAVGGACYPWGVASIERVVERLREPLSVLATQGLGPAGSPAVAEPAKVAETLRARCDDLLAIHDAPEVRAWRRILSDFERLDEGARLVEIARGLRLCRVLAGARALNPPRAARVETQAPVDGLGASVATLPGIGPAMCARLAERGLFTVEDLIWFVPRRYDDARQVIALSELGKYEEGTRVCVRGNVASCRFVRRGRRGFVDLRLENPGESITGLVVRFFNAFGPMNKRFPDGASVTLTGKIGRRNGVCEMSNPDILSVTIEGDADAFAGTIIPRYGDVPGVPPATMRKACRRAAAHSREVVDGVPVSIAERMGLVSLGEALAALHDPPEGLTVEQVAAMNQGESEFHRRLAFDELFLLGVAVARRRLDREGETARRFVAAPGLNDDLAAALPFSPTGAQTRAIDAISIDISRDIPMNRLLQGDVGSGKTAVAYAAALQVARAGGQVAIMAPTEILAEQHAAAMGVWAARNKVSLALLTASTPKGARRSIVDLLGAGELKIVVGTHALLTEGVQFAALGLVVVDEQHRFGVAQRVTLREKGNGESPHLLVMTATPIPRSLALTAYGDLDVSVLDELPPGRSPIVTQVVTGTKTNPTVGGRLRAHLKDGGRAFVVCPLIERGEGDEAKPWADVTSTVEKLRTALPEVAIGAVHGRLGHPERDATMSAFRAGEVRVLVATTVIEVGVDVPQATLMVILDAHVFGLAQLHQLRGRIGRGGLAAECVLASQRGATPEGKQRLQIIGETTDGFRIADADLEMRGPGELLGAKQSGVPRLRFGNLVTHVELLRRARAEADLVVAADPDLVMPENAGLARVLADRLRDAAIYGEESG